MEEVYYLTIKNLLESANTWILTTEQVYATSEAHAVCSSKGDISNIHAFTDNLEKTIYEFLEGIDIAFMGRGTSRQW